MGRCSSEICRVDQHRSGRSSVLADVSLRLYVTFTYPFNFNRYDRFLIRTVVILAYSGWMAYASLFIFGFQTESSETSRGPSVTSVASTIVMLTSWTIFAVQQSPWSFYIYVAFPCYFWNQVILHASRPVRAWFSKTNRKVTSYGGTIIQAFLVFGILQTMVVGFFPLH